MNSNMLDKPSAPLLPDMDVAQTAADLRVKESTLAAWRSTGKRPPFWKFGRQVLYSSVANNQWKAAQRREPGLRSA